MIPRKLRLYLLPAWAALAAPLAAQRGTDDRVPLARMQAFLLEVEAAPNDGLTSYFPRHGDWTWVRALRDERGGRDRTGLWRFGPAETVRAIGEGGPACGTFDAGGGEVGPVAGSFGAHAWTDAARWRRVGRNRFVPPGAPRDSPVFVEWRREDGQWVVSSVGDRGEFTLHVLGEAREMISADTAVVPEGAAYAAEEAWYTTNMPVSFNGLRYLRYGPPRAFSEADRGYLERVGVLGRVSVYAERGTSGPRRENLYLPVSPGEFAPYQAFGPGPCT